MTEKTWVVIHVAAAPWAPAPHAAVPSFFSLWTEGQQTPHSCGSWGTLTHSNKAHGVTQGQLHHSNRIVSSKKILLNYGICACTTSTEECAGVFFLFFHLYQEGSEEVRHDTWGEQNGGMMKTFAHSQQGYLKEVPVKDRRRASKWQHHFMMLKPAWRPRLLTF